MSRFTPVMSNRFGDKPAAPQLFAIAEHHKLDVPLAIVLVINADEG
jgi:hypothetical protein